MVVEEVLTPRAWVGDTGEGAKGTKQMYDTRRDCHSHDGEIVVIAKAADLRGKGEGRKVGACRCRRREGRGREKG
jgi:hypothetical protein